MLAQREAHYLWGHQPTHVSVLQLVHKTELATSFWALQDLHWKVARTP
jgi:hypothetical protein